MKNTAIPSELLSYVKANSLNLSWNSLPQEAKEQVRAALLFDQRKICCYCMQMIDEHRMKVEHYLSQSQHEEAGLDWKNLLAACRGGDGGPVYQHTCDTKKGSARLTLDPRDVNVGRSLRYLADGTITSDSQAETKDLNEHLNLNVERLKENRAQAISQLIIFLKKRHGPTRSWTKLQLENELDKIRAARPFPEFVGALEYWLTKLIRRR